MLVDAPTRVQQMLVIGGELIFNKSMIYVKLLSQHDTYSASTCVSSGSRIEFKSYHQNLVIFQSI